MKQAWATLRFGEIKLKTVGERHVFEVQVYFNDFDPAALRVELYANGVNSAPPERVEMTRVRQLVGAINGNAYRTEVLADRPATDYTVRVLPLTAMT